MDISLIILTFNRPERCTECVLKHAMLLEGISAEILVINNGHIPVDLPVQHACIPIRLKTMPANRGAEARNEAITEARGDVLLFLDDDAFVLRHHVEELLHVFQSPPDTGAVAFRIFNGTQQEASLLPTVFHGCAVGIRKDALKKAGGYPRGYRYYAEEYHVTFRLMQHGYSIRFIDSPPHVQHLRDPSGRSKEHILHRLIMNNTRLFTAFLPWKYWGSAMRDMLQRYKHVTTKENVRRGFRKGLVSLPFSMLAGWRERTPLSNNLFSEIALLPQLETAAQDIRKAGHERVILCGCGRFPRLWVHFLKKRQIEVCAFLDTNSCWINQRIDGISVFQRLEQISFPRVALLTGLSSLAETAIWNETLSADTSCRFMAEKPASVQEKHAVKNSVSLSKLCELSVFVRENS